MFDRVVLINLARRPDRLEAFKARNFPLPFQIFRALDGDKVGCPNWFTEGSGAYACLQSHCRVLEDAIMDNVDSLLVLEDDACWEPDLLDNLKRFMSVVPDDWEQLMIGGQHATDPDIVSPGVVRCRNTGRTHAYAVRGEFKKQLLHLWRNCTYHCDWRMQEEMHRWKCYAPDPFLVGQSESWSDISGNADHVRFWNAPKGRIVVHLECDKTLRDELSTHLHYGYWLDDQGRDRGLLEALESEYPRNGVKDWVDAVCWEAASNRKIPALWGVPITADYLKDFCDEVISIKGKDEWLAYLGSR